MNEVYLAFKESRDSEDHLEHHGIKGQKWGVRRFQNPDGTRIGAKYRKKHAKQEETAKHEKVHKDYKEDADTLSDEELAKRIKRMENELKYKNQQKFLYPDKHKARKEFVKRVFVDSLQQAASEAMKTAYTEMGKRILKGIGILKDNNNGGNKGNDIKSTVNDAVNKAFEARDKANANRESAVKNSEEKAGKSENKQKSQSELNREKRWNEEKQRQAELESRREQLLNNVIKANEQRQAEAKAQKEAERKRTNEEATRRAIENRNSSDAMNEYERDKKLSETEMFYRTNMPKKRRRR
jgi:hypothetical protein